MPTPTTPATSPATRLGPPLLASLSLGLAPFLPEPHIVGKLRWVAGGANGMAPLDWADLAFHGAPWVWLVTTLLLVAIDQVRRSRDPSVVKSEP